MSTPQSTAWPQREYLEQQAFDTDETQDTLIEDIEPETEVGRMIQVGPSSFVWCKEPKPDWARSWKRLAKKQREDISFLRSVLARIFE